jgi:serine/threonine-protein kinase
MAEDLKNHLQRVLGDVYVFERELGSAGMSRVFLASELPLQRRVVIKVLPSELAGAVNTERFRREIKFAAQLQHPRVVSVLGAGIVDGIPYYVMPLIEGESLGHRLARTGELPVEETIEILCDVLSALAYAHERGIVHRDIKPDNILLASDHAVVADFGVAKALTDSDPFGGLTAVGAPIGTPAYMSPEQAAGDPRIDHRTDLYSVGALAYQMLTGQKVFGDRPVREIFAAHAMETPENIARRRPNLPKSLASLIMRSLSKRPADRQQTANEMIAELRAVTTPGGNGYAATATSPGVAGASPPSVWALTTARAGSRGLYIAAGLAALLIIGALFGLFAHKLPVP